MRPNGKIREWPARLGNVAPLARRFSRRQQAGLDKPFISVIIPVYNAEATLGECLARIFRSTYRHYEVLIIDDGSTDRSRPIAMNFPCRLLSTAGRVGPAAARNLGAEKATGSLLFFIDADVMLSPGTMGLVAERFARSDVDGLVGVQSQEMRHRSLCSQYKNLWMRYTYARQQGEVSLFYTTAAVIRRRVFLAAGGFDTRYAGPNVEDTDFGQKLARLGYRIRVAGDLEVEHVKAYSLIGLLRTDWLRAIALTRMRLRHRSALAVNTTSVPTSYIRSVPLALSSLLAFALSPVAGWPLAVVGAGLAGGCVLLNREFLGVVRASEGWRRGVAACGLLWLELLVVGAGTAAGVLTYLLGRRY